MRRPATARPATSAFALVLLFALLLGGCQKTVRGPGLDAVAYTNRHTLVRAEPDGASRTVVSVGPNVQVAPSGTKNGFTRVSIDDGRIVGWVESQALASGPVAEPTPSRRATPAAKSSQGRAAAKAETPKPQGAAVETPVADAPDEPAAPPAPATESPTPPASPPAADTGTGGLLSPREAQAAPPPPETSDTKPRPARGKQARPEAFDPF